MMARPPRQSAQFQIEPGEPVATSDRLEESGGPSWHLSWSELACRDGTPYPVEWRHTRAKTLADAFEGLRAYVGAGPLRILSGYRTVAHNEATGGSPRSQHVEGRAVDVATPEALRVDQFHARVKRFSEQVGPLLNVGGIGYYAWGAHLDVRPVDGGQLAQWTEADLNRPKRA